MTTINCNHRLTGWCDECVEKLKVQLESAQREKAQTEELLKASRAGQPLGPVIGAQTILEQEIELKRLRQENAQLAAMVVIYRSALDATGEFALAMCEVPRDDAKQTAAAKMADELRTKAMKLTPPAALGELLKPTMEALKDGADALRDLSFDVYAPCASETLQAELSRLQKLCGGNERK